MVATRWAALHVPTDESQQTERITDMSNELSILELAAEHAEVLPAREALATMDFSFAKQNLASVYAQNGSLALNGGGANSFAYSAAGQSVAVVQH
jgi:hypothetical protein